MFTVRYYLSVVAHVYTALTGTKATLRMARTTFYQRVNHNPISLRTCLQPDWYKYGSISFRPISKLTRNAQLFLAWYRDYLLRLLAAWFDSFGVPRRDHPDDDPSGLPLHPGPTSIPRFRNTS